MAIEGLHFNNRLILLLQIKKICQLDTRPCLPRSIKRNDTTARLHGVEEILKFQISPSGPARTLYHLKYRVYHLKYRVYHLKYRVQYPKNECICLKKMY